MTSLALRQKPVGLLWKQQELIVISLFQRIERDNLEQWTGKLEQMTTTSVVSFVHYRRRP